MSPWAIVLALALTFVLGLNLGWWCAWRPGVEAGAHAALWEACKRGWIGCGEWPRVNDLVLQVSNQTTTRRSAPGRN